MHRNRARWVLFVGTVILVAVAASGIATGQDRVTTTVTVVDGDGNPVSDVELSATWDGGGPANETTRANGQALVDVGAGATVTYRIHDDEYVRNDPYVVENASSEEIEIPVARSGSATITAVDDDGPVDQAIVRMVYEGSYVVNSRTDADGVHTTRDIERGQYDLTVYKGGYLRNSSTIQVDGDVSREVHIREDSRTVTVNVVDDHFSEPRSIRNASVRIPSVGSVSTLSNGETTISVPVNNRYDVTVSKAGYETNTTTLEMRESELVLGVSIQRTPALDVEAANGRVVVGETTQVTVTDEYGDPVSGASIAVDGESVAETSNSGQARVSVDERGTRNVTASYGGLEASTTIDGVEPGSGDEQDSDGGTEGETVPEFGPGFGAIGALAALLATGYLFGRA